MGRVPVPLRVALLLALVVVLLLAAVWLLQRRLVYFPDRTAPAAVPGVANVALRTSDGLALRAWLVRPPAERDRRIAVLVAPGNAGNRGDRMPLADALAAEGLTVLLLDYRGYGGNPGSPTERGLADDARAARQALLREPGIAADRLLYLGESLGAAVVTALATEHPPAGLVLRSPFTSLADVGGAHYPWLPVSLLLRDRFPVADQISRVEAPTVVVYGTADTIVPPDQSRTVAGRAGDLAGVVAVEGADHNDAALVAGDDLVRAVTDLARRV
ncbi:alpha/beta hydrolase [Asanoa sp. WMMD1127]|uniref:alpha/beta hydrolase n=1 Tax=Asanoa sp. WMMD1127 TaxID=3016107 RepID=UPI0024161036|nr:alpha/beta hydrolase [Asanoa sp. WMMD1127]MDG4824098.1 alpha/beta hydrolase [Asanoa sp. WMMD1127]